MSLLFPNFNKITNANHLANLEGNWQGSSFVLTLKDRRGKFLFANQTMAESFGFKNENDLLGLTEFDLCMTSNQATQITNNDKKILELNQPQVFYETVMIKNCETVSAISHKLPFRINNKKNLGVLCVSFVLTERKIIRPQKSFTKLSKRQNECLYFLATGMTIKEIARTMALSPRTIEHYLEAIKIKLNCKSRSELVKIYITCD